MKNISNVPGLQLSNPHAATQTDKESRLIEEHPDKPDVLSNFHKTAIVNGERKILIPADADFYPKNGRN